MTATKEPPALTPDISSRPIKKAHSRSPFAIVDLYKSSVGKKWVMALTGVALMGFVFFHMVGNLKMYLGPTEFNHYAEFLRELLVPIVPRTVALWLLRFDLACRTGIVRSGWALHTARCLRLGYAWLALAGGWGVANALRGMPLDAPGPLHMLLLGFVFAMVMHRVIFARGVIRTSILIPYGIITVVSAFAWQFAFSLNNGFVNAWFSWLPWISADTNWFGSHWPAMFAIMEPGAHLNPHRDPFGGSLRYHLGLITPNDDRCFIDVDGERYSWRDGQGVMFDETYIHYAENGTDENRIILLCDIERPMTQRWAQSFNGWFARNVMTAASSPNSAGWAYWYRNPAAAWVSDWPRRRLWRKVWAAR